MNKTREEHLQWCKNRANEYLNQGNIDEAFASMCSDIMKHPETMRHENTNQLGFMMKMSGNLDTIDKMRKWINGYN